MAFDRAPYGAYIGYRNPKDAFEDAIKAGRLSRDESAPNYAGNYMYMGQRADGRGDAFKHSLTRQYLA